MRVLLLVCLVGAVCLEQSHPALAQQTTSSASTRLSPAVIDGSKEPNRIPDRTIQSALMMNLAALLRERPERFAKLAQDVGLSSSDTNATKPHLGRLYDTLVALRRQSTSIIDSANLVQLSNPVQRAALARSTVEAANQGTADAWNGVLDSLSSQGREALLRYMEREKRNVKLLVPPPAPTQNGGSR